METFRNNKSGRITIRGQNFEIFVETDGRITLSGVARVVDSAESKASVSIGNNADRRSPRSNVTKRRGSR